VSLSAWRARSESYRFDRAAIAAFGCRCHNWGRHYGNLYPATGIAVHTLLWCVREQPATTNRAGSRRRA